MTKQSLIQKTIELLNRLPQDKVNEVSDFIDFILKKHDEEVISEGIKKITTANKAYGFLKSEEDLYSVSDLKEKYNGKG